MLPDNAKFIYENGRGQLPHYDIVKAAKNEKLEPKKVQSFFPVYPQGRRDLPEGFEIRRGYTENPIAVPLDQQSDK